MSETLSLKAKLSVDANDYIQGIKAAIDAQAELASSSDKVEQSLTGQMTAANLASAVIQKAFSAITGAIGDAVKRIDTLNNYPRVMESLGYSSEDAERSINSLSEGIEGLPTTLDSIVSSSQRLTAALGDMGEGTKTAIALNDLFLAGGGGAEAAARGMEQYNQMLAAGKVDMQSWKTLLEVAPGQMNQLAQSMLGASATQKTLYDALQSGKVSIEEMNAAVIKLDKEGGDGFASFADQARAATGGIGTAWANVQTAVTKGVAKVIDAVDKAAKEAGGAGIADALNGIKTVITAVFNGIASVASFVVKHLKTILTVVGAIAAAFVASKIGSHLKEIKGLLSSLGSAFSSAKGSVMGFNAALEANPIGAVITLITSLISVVTVLTDVLESETSKAFKQFIDKNKEVVSSSQEARQAAEESISTTEAQAAATDSLVNEIVDLMNQEERSTEDKVKLKSKVAELNASMDDLNLAYDEENDELNMSTVLLRKKAQEYSKQARATAIEEAMTDALREQAQVQAQLAIAEKMVNEYSDEAKEYFDENGKALAFLNKIIPNVGGGLGNLAQTYEELTGSVADLTDEEAAQQAVIDSIAEEYAAVQEEMTRVQQEEEAKRVALEQQAMESRQRVLANFIELQQGALDRALANGTATMDMLSQKNQDTAQKLQETWQNYKDAATNIFDQLSGESELSVDKMIENLHKNQEVISQMGDNMASLRDRFASLNLDQAILDQLQDMGPQAAGEIANLAQASEDQLIELANTYSQGGTLAWDSYTYGMGAGADAAAEQVRSLATQTEESLRTALEGTNWHELSEAKVQEYAEGLGMDAQAIAASKKLATDSINAVKDTQESNSPSKVYEGMGKDAVTGYANGLSALATRPVTIIRSIMTNVLAIVRGQIGTFEVLGRNAGNGFANGLESTRSRIMQVAASIANAVTQTIQKALNEHSPSKVLEKLGSYAGQGFAIGLAKTEAMVERVSGSIANTVSDAVSSPYRSFSAAYAGGGSMEIQSLRADLADLKNAILSQPIEVTSSFDVNGREMAKGTATYMRDELNRQSTLTNNLGGNR